MTSSKYPTNSTNSNPNATAQLVSWLSIAAMLAVAAWGWVQIPGGQSIAVHFDVLGKPDGYAPKPIALLMLPAIMSFACAFFWYRLQNEKFKENLEKSKAVTYISLFGAIVIIFEAQLVIVLTALGHQIPITTVIFVSTGLLLGAIGVVMAAGKTALAIPASASAHPGRSKMTGSGSGPTRWAAR